MAFENDYFKFSRPLAPTIIGKNTRIEVQAGQKTRQQGVHTYNYDRQPLSKLYKTAVDVNGKTVKHVVNKLNVVNRTHLKEHDVEYWNRALPLELNVPFTFDLKADVFSPRWVGEVKITATLKNLNLATAIYNPQLSGFKLSHLQ